MSREVALPLIVIDRDTWKTGPDDATDGGPAAEADPGDALRSPHLLGYSRRFGNSATTRRTGIA